MVIWRNSSECFLLEDFQRQIVWRGQHPPKASEQDCLCFSAVQVHGLQSQEV